MLEDKSISVIIPSYNSVKTIEACLTSIVNQSLKLKEIIVVDDGSTDETVKKINHLKKKLPFLKLLTQAHQGPGRARNLGVKQALGTIIVLVDADMEFDAQFIEQLTLPIRKGTAKGTWSGNEWVKNWDNVWARCWNFNYNRRAARMVSNNKGQKRVFRSILKSEFDKAKGFDNIGYTDDWTLGSKLGYEPKVTTAKFYHKNPDTLLAVYGKAVWIGKRPYKLGKIGTIYTIFKANAFFSFLIGLTKGLIFLTPAFIVFKLIYDLGIMVGAVNSLFNRRY